MEGEQLPRLPPPSAPPPVPFSCHNTNASSSIDNILVPTISLVPQIQQGFPQIYLLTYLLALLLIMLLFILS